MTSFCDFERVTSQEQWLRVKIFLEKNPPKDLKEGPVYKAKGTRLKYIPGSVLTKTFETIVLASNTIIYLTLYESI